MIFAENPKKIRVMFTPFRDGRIDREAFKNLVERQVLENLIMTELQVQRALQTGIRISDADIDQTLVRVAESNGITVQQMRQTLEAQGIEFAEFRRDIAEQLMTDRLQQRIVSSMEPVTDTEVDILLASEDASGGEYNVSHIMVALPDGSTPQQIAEAQAKVDDIHQRLMDGLDFASAASAGAGAASDLGVGSRPPARTQTRSSATATTRTLAATAAARSERRRRRGSGRATTIDEMSLRVTGSSPDWTSRCSSSSSLRRSRAVWKRRRGSFSRHRRTGRSMAGSIPSTMAEGASGSSSARPNGGARWSASGSPRTV